MKETITKNQLIITIFNLTFICFAAFSCFSFGKNVTL